MIMRISWGKIKPGKWDEFERLWNLSAAKMNDTEGLLAHWLARDSETENAGYSISLWTSRAAIDAGPVMFADTPEVKDCFSGQYVLTMCDVRGSEIAGLLKSRS